jgi:hypothetical protein
MARSLVVKHDEAPRTSGLFTALLILSAGFLLLGAAALASADAGDDIDPGPSLTTLP